MTVSVLIPCHNAERWIAEAIESALAQTMPDTEVIVVDDGSTDASLGIIQRFDKRVHWEALPNRGAPSARNRLLELARGTWVQYLDADDYLLPDKIADQWAAVTLAPNPDVIYGPVTIEWREQASVRTELQDVPEPRDPWALLAFWRLPQTGAPLWRRQALIDVGGWRVGQPCCQEHELYLRLLMAGKRFHYHSATGAVYRRFANGTLSTRDTGLVRRERLKITQRMEDHLRAAGELTALRQQAINQGRFDIARSVWPVDREQARSIHAAIVSTQQAFRPVGIAAPLSYRVAYSLGGFEVAERLAGLKRDVSRLAGHVFSRP